MPLDPTRAKMLFLAASDIADPAVRNTYLDHECAGDAELRVRVEALLRADVSPVAETGTMEFTPHPSVARGPDEQAGAVIADKYTLIEPIGEGGMGSVWRAMQTEPLKRLVAVKLIKSGMDSKLVLARFDAERQALALMDHPNIARIYDGGVTDQGQPYFVMELVQGLPLTHYCDQKRFAVTQRLELFVSVCQAVQHAHQKGIIHRDLKPGNVLVTEIDGRPTPKVIDFGIAKAIDHKLSGQNLTELGPIIGTPAYMSPEQVDSSTDIDTRSDIYSLGVIFYELLVGTPPIEAGQFKRGAVLEMLRILREVDPPKPSTRLSSSVALANIAANRHLEPEQLKRTLRGDLDWIAMKALEKDRNRRYETANNFAADVLRHLSLEPVLAAPPSRVYRLRKFIKKHRGLVAASALIVLVLVAGIIGTTWGLIHAERRRLDAEAARAAAAERLQERDEAAAKAQAAAELASRREADAIEAGNAIKKSMEQAARREAEAVAARHNVEILMRTLSEAINFSKSKSMTTNASPELRKILAAFQSRVVTELTKLGRTIETPAASTQDLIMALQVATFLKTASFHKESREIYEKALTLAERLAKQEPGNWRPRANLGIIERQLGEAIAETDPRMALAHFRRCRDLFRELEKNAGFGSTDARRQLAHTAISIGKTRLALGQAAEAQNDFAEALVYYEEWTAKAAKGVATEPLSYTMEAEMWLGTACGHRADAAGVEKHFTKALTIGRDLLKAYPQFGPYLIDLAQVQAARGEALLTIGKFEEAARSEQEAIDNLEMASRKNSDDLSHLPWLALAHEHSGIANTIQKQGPEAKKHFAAAMEQRKSLWEIDRTNVTSQINMVLAMARGGDLANSIRLLPTVAPRLAKSPELMLQLARCYAVLAASDAANRNKYLQQSLAAVKSAVGDDYKDVAVLLADPELALLRDEPAFQDVIAKIKSR